ncbi:MAG: winged helix-turn-helix domain-containing protein [Candidatus Geothermarchaeales archaeon]
MNGEGSGLVARAKIWLEDGSGRQVVGSGLASLLEKIDEKGSVSSAAKELGMSYRYALHRITIAEERLGTILVRRRRGGRGGGRSHLTEEGRRYQAEYKRLEERIQRVLEGF